MMEVMESAARATLTGKRAMKEKDFSLKFSMVLFAFLLFVLLKLHLYKFLISSTSFFTSSIIFIINKLLEFQLRGGKNCAFDGIVIKSRNGFWQPTARIYRSSYGILLVDLQTFMF